MLILTNYYYSVACLFCLFVYSLYLILKEENCSLKGFITKFLVSVRIFIIPVLLCAFVLLPTAYALVSNSRSFRVTPEIKELFIPRLENILYISYAIGITGLMLVSVIGNLSCKKIKKSAVFLYAFLIFIVLCPFFSYALNGFLYVREKVLIPFGILYVYSLCDFIQKLKYKNINLARCIVFTSIFILLCIILNQDNIHISICLIASLFVTFLFRKRPKLLFVYTIIFLIAASYINNST